MWHAVVPALHPSARLRVIDRLDAAAIPAGPFAIDRRSLADRVVNGQRAVARLVRAVDFERVLRTRSIAGSAHFALHHLAVGPTVWQSRQAAAGRLPDRTARDDATTIETTADRIRAAIERPAPAGLWLGCVVPKRHARRAVTRSLLKRQIRAVVSDAGNRLAAGLWVVRLRAPFDPQRYVSAASSALRTTARDELRALIGRAGGALPPDLR